MISERLDNIIKAAINDNKLAEAKSIIYRRAQSEGVSQKEIDNYINSLMSAADKPKYSPSAKSGGFPKELEFLVKEYLTDGIIAAKERQVLLRKAQQMGVDVDEFDLYIDAQQQKVDQIADAEAEKKRGRICPNCGRQIPSLTIKCECGYEFQSVEHESSIKKLIDEISRLDKLWHCSGCDHEKLADQIVNTISTFNVPNTREDILEFCSVAMANSKLNSPDIYGWMNNIKESIPKHKISKAWKVKAEQVISQGRCLRGDFDFTQQLDYFESQLNKKNLFSKLFLS